MTMLPMVTVIVPVLNGAATIGPCLESLRRLDYPAERREIIVVDNGSTDNTDRVLAAAGPGIVVEHESRRGPGAARNRGLARATGDIVAFTDADCVVDASWLRKLIAPLQDPGVGISGGAIRAAEPCNAVQRFGDRVHDHHDAIEVCRPPYAITMNWASRRDVVRDAGGFDPRFRRCEDVDLAYRLQQRGYRLAFVPEAVVYHHHVATLPALFGKGFAHGLHSVHALKVHRDFVRPFGHRAVNPRSYVELAATCARALRRAHRPAAACECVFNVGKKLGKVAGSFRRAYVEL